jgi:hypothetical protein
MMRLQVHIEEWKTLTGALFATSRAVDFNGWGWEAELGWFSFVVDAHLVLIEFYGHTAKVLPGVATAGISMTGTWNGG